MVVEVQESERTEIIHRSKKVWFIQTYTKESGSGRSTTKKKENPFYFVA